ncbi:transposase [Corynebacterium diphtheriae]|nr:transposase [Corynebacterium diphtheriae]OJH93050.1 transposase [Corynebacterium diphtheriae]
MSALIDTLVGMKDAVVAEIVQLGRTMNKRRKGILAYFDHKQCTLKPEEPPFGGISKDFSQNFTPNRFQTGRLAGFGVKCRLFGGERGWRAHQRPPAPANPSQAMVVKTSYSA